MIDLEDDAVHHVDDEEHIVCTERNPEILLHGRA